MTNDLRKLAKEIEKATIEIKNNAIEVVNTLETFINNDVTKRKEISLSLRFRLQRQSAKVEEGQPILECEKY